MLQTASMTGSGHLAGYRVYPAQVGVRVCFLNLVKTLTSSMGMARFSGIFSHFLFCFFFANFLLFFSGCYIFIANRHGCTTITITYQYGFWLPIPLSNGCPLPLSRGPGPLSPTTHHLPMAMTASMPCSISSMPTATLPLRAHHAPQLMAIMATTHGEDKTRRRHPHTPHRAPRHLTAAPTTNGHDGDDAWRGQTCRCYMHAPHRAPRGCVCHALRGPTMPHN